MILRLPINSLDNSTSCMAKLMLFFCGGFSNTLTNLIWTRFTILVLLLRPYFTRCKWIAKFILLLCFIFIRCYIKRQFLCYKNKTESSIMLVIHHCAHFKLAFFGCEWMKKKKRDLDSEEGKNSTCGYSSVFEQRKMNSNGCSARGDMFSFTKPHFSVRTKSVHKRSEKK